MRPWQGDRLGRPNGGHSWSSLRWRAADWAPPVTPAPNGVSGLGWRPWSGVAAPVTPPLGGPKPTGRGSRGPSALTSTITRAEERGADSAARVVLGGEQTPCSSLAPRECVRLDQGLLDVPDGRGASQLVRTIVYRLAYSYEDERSGEPVHACAVMRINEPMGTTIFQDASADNPVGIVFFVNGTAGVGVGCAVDTRWNDGRLGHSEQGDDDFPSVVLAAGADLVEVGGEEGQSFGRTGSAPVVTVHVNNPSYLRSPTCGEARLSDPVEAFEGVSADGSGDDNCGAATVAAYEMAMLTLYEHLSANHGLRSDHTRLVLCSFSNGLTCATHWLATTRHDVHALIDLEGPTDSFEQLVCAECSDPLGQYNCNGRWMPSSLGLSTWRTCVDGGRQPGCQFKGSASRTMFEAAWARYYRPPTELGTTLGVFGATTGSYPTPPIPSGGPDFDPGVLPWLDEFWESRRPATFLSASGRKGAYIRINDLSDHVQPDHYKNRHALRALLAAASARACPSGQVAADVYWADESYLEGPAPGEPARFNGLAVDPDSYSLANWPAWTDIEQGSARKKWAVQVDLARWALSTDFNAGCETP